MDRHKQELFDYCGMIDRTAFIIQIYLITSKRMGLIVNLFIVLICFVFSPLTTSRSLSAMYDSVIVSSSRSHYIKARKQKENIIKFKKKSETILRE